MADPTMPEMLPWGPAVLDRMVEAVENVRRRLVRATQALESAGIPYAVIGGNAVAAWVARVDRAAVRNTQDVDILLHRDDLGRAIIAMESAGFRYRRASGDDMFLDGPDAKARDAVHIVFAGEKVRPEFPEPAPLVRDVEREESYRILSLPDLVRMKLTSYRIKDRMHLLDLIGVSLIDASWPATLPPVLAERLQELLNNPES